jgi:hypothetical protein
MSISRYHDVGEMPPVGRATGDQLVRRIRAAWARARRLVLGDPGYRRGVQRFASLEEAQAERESATQARIERLRAGPVQGPSEPSA